MLLTNSHFVLWPRRIRGEFYRQVVYKWIHAKFTFVVFCTCMESIDVLHVAKQFPTWFWLYFWCSCTQGGKITRVSSFKIMTLLSVLVRTELSWMDKSGETSSGVYRIIFECTFDNHKSNPGDNFSGRPSTPTDSFFMNAPNGGIIFSQGQEWKEQRSFAITVLRSANNEKRMRTPEWGKCT